MAEICRRLEGLPLAIGLAAARSRLLSLDVLRRLTESLEALGSGAVDLPERQHTLRATGEWSVGLLDDAERSLLEVASVFVDGWTIDAVADVAGIEEDRALDLTEALAGHSLIYLDVSDRGPRARLLVTFLAVVSERLAARPDAGEIRRRHAEYFRALAERTDRPLRSLAPSESMRRLQAEPATSLRPCAGTWRTIPPRCPTSSGSFSPSGSSTGTRRRGTSKRPPPDASGAPGTTS